MARIQYTQEQMTEAERFYDLIEKTSIDKRFIASMVATAFINGMDTQESLSAATLEPNPPDR